MSSDFKEEFDLGPAPLEGPMNLRVIRSFKVSWNLNLIRERGLKYAQAHWNLPGVLQRCESTLRELGVEHNETTVIRFLQCYVYVLAHEKRNSSGSAVPAMLDALVTNVKPIIDDLESESFDDFRYKFTTFNSQWEVFDAMRELRFLGSQTR